MKQKGIKQLNLTKLNIKDLFENYRYFIIGKTDYYKEVWSDDESIIEGYDNVKTEFFGCEFESAIDMVETLSDISESDGTSEGHERTTILLQQPNNKELTEIEEREQKDILRENEAYKDYEDSNYGK